MNRRVTVRALVVKDGKILCAKLKPYHDSIKGDFWCTPGGGIDDGEALLPALHREMMEETGIAPQIGDLLYIQQFVGGGSEHLEFFFHVTNSDDYLDIDLSKTSHGVEEIETLTFIDPTAEKDVRPSFLMTEPVAAHIAAHEPPKLFAFFA
ncbi:MAG TPA: NUDIX domain-containing protein [Patescibacteria group bacterium]|nr:NUDIX domain-containing protein [Patescibacteria group bacterium]